MRNVYLTASVRTPIGRFGGTLASDTVDVWSAKWLVGANLRAKGRHPMTDSRVTKD
ncbi:MAG: hypothetical protein AABN95_18805 [Acidobacteriota bacterium]